MTEWKKNGGWVIDGGVEKFHMRVQAFCGEKLPNPQYMGLAAGRLMGHKEKLPTEVSDELQFSMKCIVGAIVLVFGVKDAWSMFRPYFFELLLVSPEETRRSFMGVTDIVSNYQKGKR